MSELIDHLAELTGFRDRDVLDVTLIGALEDLLAPATVAIHRCVGLPGDERWMTRMLPDSGAIDADAGAAWIDPQTLPRLASDPARRDCLVRQALVQVRTHGGHHAALFPLVGEREAVGVVEIRGTEALDAQAQRLVGSILRIYRNFQSLLDYSERDTLTGLLNRKTFDDSFLKAASAPFSTAVPVPDARRRREDGATYWLGLVDIDHFKAVNDNHGHLIGDEVLLLLSRLMRATFRCQDRLYRFGGEEFVALIRCAGEQDAAMAFERLRRHCERYPFPQVGHITVSIGFTEVRPGDAPNDAFERADRAVYHAKDNGRNQVQSHAGLVASGRLAEEAAVRAGPVELF